MRRTFLLICACLLGSALLPAAVRADRPLDSYCSPSGDYCTGIAISKGEIYFTLRTFSFSDQYKLCVEPPLSRRECGWWQLKKGKHGIYSSRVPMKGHYPTTGPGRYKATWYYGGKTRLGRPLYFGSD